MARFPAAISIHSLPMSQTSSSPRRRQRGGRPRQRSPRGGNSSRQDHRDHDTFPRPRATAPSPGLWQKILGFFGLGRKKPATRAARARSGAESPRPAKTPAPVSSKPREERPARAPRPLMLHEITNGRLYVGNLSYDVAESDLFDLFSGFGKVKQTEVVCHRQTQRSKGFGFVEMLSVDEARRAAEELHDKEFMGRKLLVTGAKNDAPPARESAPESAPSETPLADASEAAA